MGLKSRLANDVVLPSFQKCAPVTSLTRVGARIGSITHMAVDLVRTPYWRVLSVIALVLVAAKSSLIEVTSTSMADTICSGDFIVATGVGLLRFVATPAGAINRGDIILFTRRRLVEVSTGPSLVVKRVIALSGDHLRVTKGIVYVNGHALNEPYVRHANTYNAALDTWPRPALGDFGSDFEVPPAHYFVMGDNRDESFDSRATGSIDRSEIVGAVLLSWPPARLRWRCR